MPVEFKTQKPLVNTIAFADGTTIEDAIVRTSALPQGVDTNPLAPYDPKDGRGYQSNVNIHIQPKEILLWPARTFAKVPQGGIELKYGRFNQWLPAQIKYNGQIMDGIFYPVFQPSTTVQQQFDP